ncbi:MAG: TlpA family protein disulfide reductase [Bacteroidia bacterium]|nr:TlpA family protein disulfide reductase [Bacteroidia bacterium]
MKYMFLILLLVGLSCKEDKNTAERAETTASQSSYNLEVYDYEGLKPLLYSEDDKLHVINFWATWCAPCIKELPYFESLTEDFSKDKVEVLLVSLDFPRQYKTKLIPYIEKNKLKSRIVALNDTDQNTWIPGIDKEWSGAIPATIIYKGDKRKFYEGSFTREELLTEIKQFLN